MSWPWPLCCTVRAQQGKMLGLTVFGILHRDQACEMTALMLRVYMNMLEKSQNRDDYQDVPRLIGAMARTFPDSYLNDWHSHARVQLAYATSGSMEIRTHQGVWMVAPQQAFWIPAGVEHQMRAHGVVHLHTLFINPQQLCSSLPQHEAVINVSPLLRELLLRATQLPIEYDEAGAEGKIMDLILAELQWHKVAPLCLPIVQDVRLQRLQEGICLYPADKRSMQEWAAELHMSPKTLYRLVLKETGTSFNDWRQALLIYQALPRLLAGEKVTSIALDLGYSSAAAFTRMFKRIMGATPSEYISSKA